MCGIVGAVAQKNIVPVLLEGLKRLEYRGYDSCGIAVYQNETLRRARSTDRVAELAAQVEQEHIEAFTGISHTGGPHMAHLPPITHTHTSRVMRRAAPVLR